MNVSYSYHYYFCSLSILQPGFPTGPWLCKDQANLPGKEQLTKLFLVTGNLIPISDAKVEANSEVGRNARLARGRMLHSKVARAFTPTLSSPAFQSSGHRYGETRSASSGTGVGRVLEAGRFRGCNTSPLNVPPRQHWICPLTSSEAQRG